MANIFEFLSKDRNITPEKARKSRQMQFHDKTAYVWGLCYRWDPSLLMNPVRRFAHFMPPCLQQSHTSTNTRYTHSLLLDWRLTWNIVGHANHYANPSPSLNSCRLPGATPQGGTTGRARIWSLPRSFPATHGHIQPVQVVEVVLVDMGRSMS